MNDFCDEENERCDIFIELGHLAWLVKYAVRGKTSVAYGFLDGITEAVMSSSGCSTEDMVSVAASLRRAFGNAAENGIHDCDATDAREAAR